MGKGSKRRPMFIEDDEFDNNWDKTFRSSDYDLSGALEILEGADISEQLFQLQEKIETLKEKIENAPESLINTSNDDNLSKGSGETILSRENSKND